MTEKLETVRGSGNVFADLGLADADVEQAKALLAAEIIHILDEEGLSVREAERRTGVPYTDFSRIRNAAMQDRLAVQARRTPTSRSSLTRSRSSSTVPGTMSSIRPSRSFWTPTHGRLSTSGPDWLPQSGASLPQTRRWRRFLTVTVRRKEPRTNEDQMDPSGQSRSSALAGPHSAG
jgi:hypothetical protein